MTLRTADQRARAEPGDLPTGQSHRAGQAPVAGVITVVALSPHRHPLLPRPDLLSTAGAPPHWIGGVPALSAGGRAVVHHDVLETGQTLPAQTAAEVVIMPVIVLCSGQLLQADRESKIII